MSHFSRIKTKFVDKELLLKALADLDYEVEQGDVFINGFGGQKTAVDIRIRRRLSYDIGLKYTGDHYTIIADWFGVRGIKQNEFERQVSQRYAYHAAREKMEEQGFNLVEEKEENGRIRLVLRRTA